MSDVHSAADQPDVAIIGGGLAGLFAAIAAADSGARPVVFESRRTLGGRGRTDVTEGAHLNLGPHAVYRGGVLQRELDRLRISLTGGVPNGAKSRFLRSDRVRLVPVSDHRTAVVGAMSKLGAGKDPALDRISIAEWAESSLGRSEDTVAWLFAMTRLTSYVDAPDRFAARPALMQIRSALRHNVRYLDGGWGPMVEALRVAAAERGVRFAASTAVERVEPATRWGRRCWTVVTAERETVVGSVVVAAGGPAVARRLLALPDAFAVGPPVEASVLDVIVPRPPKPGVLIGVDQPLYLSTHHPVAKLLDRPGALVGLMHYLPPGGEVPEPATIREGLLTHLDRTDVAAGEVEWSRYLHRMTVAGGLPAAHLGGLAGRPGVAVDERPGVFIAGDWVGPEGLLADASAASGTSAGTAAARVASTAAPVAAGAA